MTATLDRRIAGLRGRLRRILALRGLCWTLFAAVMAFIAITWVDWVVPLAWDVRLAALAVASVVVILVAWRELVRPMAVPFDDLRLALLIERRWPQLNERLSSTIAFLKSREAGADPHGRLGSEALRELTIRQASREVEGLDFRRIVEPRPMFLAATLAAWAVAVLVIETVAAPEFQAIAVRRFLLGDVPWPKRTELAIADAPAKIARGMPYEVTARAEVGRELPVVPPRAWFEVLGHVAPPLRLLEGTLRGRPPGSARVVYRFDDGETVSAALRPDDSGSFHGRLDVVNKPFRFYVAAGDDATDWVRVAVVPPPALDEVRVRLIPPAYTRPFATEAERLEAVETLAPDQTQIRAIEGARIQFVGRSNKPLASATLMNDDEPTGIAVTLGEDASRLDTQIDARGSGSFWFALRDRDGFGNPEATRYELRSIVDTPPLALIVEPQFDVSVPPSATVPVRIRAEDDYGLQLIRLLYTVSAPDSADAEDRFIPLWEAEAAVDAGRSQTQEIGHRLDLATMDLEPGALITAHAEARDFFTGPDDAGPHLTRSRALRIRVISEEEFRGQLDDRRREIREEIERIYEMQKLAMPPVREAITEIDAADRVAPETGERLREASVMQRQVGGRLDESGNGLSDRLQRFLDEMENARMGDPEVADQMRQMKAVVDRIRAEHLRPAEQGITRALRDLETRPPGAPRQAGQPEAGREDRPSQPPSDDRAEDGRLPEPRAGQTPGPGTEPIEGQPEPDEGRREAEGAEPDDQAARPSQPSGPAAAGPRQSLDESRESQQAIAQELEAMLRGMSEFETLRGVTREAERLLNDQDAVARDTERRATDPGLMGKTPDQLDAQQRAALENIADRQRDVSRELQDLANRMGEMTEGLAETDPLTAEALEDALEQIRRQGTPAQLGQAADQIARNQMGPANRSQDEGREAIQDLVDTLKNRRENDLERLVKQLQEARAELAQAQRQQADLLEKTRQAQGKEGQQGGQQGQQGEQGGQQGEQGGQADRDRLQQLAKEQQQLEQELRRQLQRLRKLRAEQAARAGSRAASRMGNAGQNLDEGDAEQARRNEEEALQDLQQAIAETDQAIQEAQDRLLMEQFAKIRDQLRAYNDRQRRLIEETVAFEARRGAAGGRLSRADSFDVRNLGRAQAGLKDETTSLAERLDGAPVFKLSLERATARMGDAAEQLAEIRTDDETQRAEEDASRWLERLVASLNPPDDEEQQGGQQQQGGGQGQDGQGNQGDGIPAEAQIRMLKAMQEEINIRTQELDELRRRDEPLDDDQEREFVRLEEDQHTIADLLRDLIRPRRPDGLED